MAIRTISTQRVKDRCRRYASMFLRGIIEPSAYVTDAKQRRRVRLLSIFLLLIAINTLIGSIVMRNADNSAWPILMTTSAILFTGYVLSRTRYYRLATIFAVITPSLPIINMIIFDVNQDNFPNELPWLALPLLVSSLLLSLRSTILIAFSYIVLIAILMPFVNVSTAILSQTLAFMLMMFFFVVSLTATRQQDESEIEHQLAERKQAEDALKEREKRFSDIAENALEWIWEVDAGGKYTYSSPVVEEILGYKPEEILEKHFYDFFHPEDKEKMKEAAFEAFAQKQPFHEFVNRNVRKDGETVFLSTSGVPVMNEAGKLLGYRGVDTDITERKLAEVAIRESEEKFYKAFSFSPDVVSIVNLKDNRFVDVNDSYTRYTGYTPEEVIGHTTDELNIWANEEERDRIVSALKEKGSVRYEEIHTLTKSGEIRVGLFSAERIKIGGDMCSITVIVDITERKKREQLQNHENYILTLLGQGAELSEILEAIVRLGESHDPSIKGSILLFDSSREWLNPASGPNLPEEYSELLKDGIPIGPIMGSCGTAAYHKERVIVPDIEHSPLFEKEKEVVKRAVKNSLLACWSQPIIGTNGDLLGTIANYSNKVGEPDADDLTVLEWSARIAAIAIERRRAEETLADEATRRRILIEQSRDGIVILDQDGRVYEANQQFADMLGYSIEEVHQLSVFDWEYLYPKEQVIEMIRSVDEAGDHFETQHRRKDGTTYEVEISTNGAWFAGQKLVFCVCRDITERKQAEERLRLAESAVDASISAIGILDFTGKLIYLNRAHVKLFGYKSPEEMLGKTVVDLAKEGEVIENGIRNMATTGSVGTVEAVLKKRDGTEFIAEISPSLIVDAQGQPMGVTASIVDITERKRAEEALRESEERFSKAFLASPDSIAVVRMRDNRFIEVNDSFVRLNGYTREEVVGRTASDLHIWADAEERNRILKLMNKRGGVRNEEFRYRKKSGEIGIGLFSAERINIGGEPHSIALTADITERKRAEEKLKESEEFSSSLMRSSAVPIQVINGDTSIRYVNPAFEKLTGFTSDEIIGRKAPMPWWINDRASGNIDELKRDMTKGILGLEKLFQKKDGEQLWVEVTSAPVKRDGKFQYSLENWLDITERKRAEEALKESEEKFSKAFRLSPDMVTINTLGKDGIFIDISDSFIRTTGYSREEVIGHSSIELGIWASKEDNDRIIQILMKHGRVHNEEYAMRMKSGEIRVWLFSIEPIKIGGEECVICVNTDITERKRVEEALRESEERFSKAFRSSPDAIAITSLKDDTFIDVNDSFVRIVGYSREEAIGQCVFEIDTWVNQEELDKAIREIDKHGRIRNAERVFRTKAGEIRAGLFSAEKINIGGEPCLISVTTDITERKRAEEELKQALSNLEESSAQLAATNKELEAFSYSVSHDLRSPLRSIDGFSQALLEDYMDRLDEDGQDYLRRLRGASQKMGELIDGLLKLSRLTRNEMHREKVNLSVLAKEITSRLKETQPDRRVDFVIGQGLTVNGDRQLLRVLMENLLGNAWKFTSKCKQAKIEFGATQNGGKKAYFIKDNGAGFDMTYANRLFSAFQRLHETTEFPGTGIGLATVQRIINRHGGSVWAEGAMEKGATFYFTLN